MSVMARRPSFFGAVRGEALKISRQLSFWLMLAGAIVLLVIMTLAITSAQNIQDQLKADPTAWAYGARDVFGTVFQIGSGIFLLIIGSRLFAMEYSSGTVRILYARGMGRLSLLLAKMLILAVLGIVLLAGFLVIAGGIFPLPTNRVAGFLGIAGGILALLANAWAGSVAPLQHLPTEFWRDLGMWAVVQGMSM